MADDHVFLSDRQRHVVGVAHYHPRYQGQQTAEKYKDLNNPRYAFFILIKGTGTRDLIWLKVVSLERS